MESLFLHLGVPIECTPGGGMSNDTSGRCCAKAEAARDTQLSLQPCFWLHSLLLGCRRKEEVLAELAAQPKEGMDLAWLHGQLGALVADARAVLHR